MKKFFKTKVKDMNAITLIALVITIVVLIILATVAITLSLGNNGIFNRAKTAKEKYANAQEYEQDQIAKSKNEIDFLTSSSRDNVQSSVPVGSIMSCIRDSMPEGYLACDGSVYNKSDYPELFDALDGLDHTGWTTADWSTQFSVPDLRGEFLRGSGTNTTTTISGSSVGKHQNGTKVPGMWKGSGTFQVTGSDGTQINSDTDTYTGQPSSTWDVYNRARTSGSASGNGIVRPTNTSVMYCIKY